MSVSPIITLTTDFGAQDHYVGAMKGVLLTRCPTAQLVDITHEIPPFSIQSGAYAISQAAPYFPPHTVHVVVVDPGVGTERKPLLLEASNQIFIAPDNGVLSMIRERDPQAKAREMSNRQFWLENPSSTFHGRDIFAAVAAAVASGAANPSDVGPGLSEIQLLPGLDAIETEAGTWRGIILSVDRFGNIITNFRVAQFPNLDSRHFIMDAGTGRITRFQFTFHNASKTGCFIYPGSSGFLEIGMNQKSAAEGLHVRPGDPLMLHV